MARFSILLFLGLFFLAHHAQASDVEIRKGEAISEDLATFDELDLSGVFNLEIIQSNKHRIEIEGKERDIEKFRWKVKNGRLKVWMKGKGENKKNRNINISDKTKMKIYTKHLSDLDASFVGNMKFKYAFEEDDVDVDIDMVGNAELKFICDRFEADFSHVGNVSIEGSCKVADIDNSSIGKVGAADFKCKRLDLDHSGIGNVEVYASEELDVDSSSMGAVYYYGNPKEKHIDDNMFGRVKRGK